MLFSTVRDVCSCHHNLVEHAITVAKDFNGSHKITWLDVYIPRVD